MKAFLCQMQMVSKVLKSLLLIQQDFVEFYREQPCQTLYQAYQNCN